MMNRLLVFVWSILLVAPAVAWQPPSPQSEFRPMSEVPPTEQLPAAPLLIAAYVFFLMAVLFYVWTVWRRLNKVEAEIRAIEKKPQKTRPAP
jgi:hypothetical protein